MQKSATGSAPPEVIFEADSFKLPTCVTADGKTLVFQNNDSKSPTGWDVWTLSLENRTASPLIRSTFVDNQPQVSPDGRWIAYASDQSSRNDVYIEPFPPRGAKWQLSAEGGTQPRWRRDGKELFYRTTEGAIMSVPISASGDTLEISTPVPLFTVALPSAPGFQYDVSADGSRFLVNAANADRGSAPVTFVTNWAADLK
jgi:hypothetical protein